MKTETVARTGLVKGGLMRFKPLPALEELDPGVTPHEFTVLVLQREIEERTIGSIIVPESSRDREQDAAVEGLLVAVSPAAFTYEGTAETYANGLPKPQVGQFVLFRRYGGVEIDGDDGRKYRLMNDKDIIAVRKREKLETKGAW